MDLQTIWNRLQNDALLLKSKQTDLQNENERLKNENKVLEERFVRFLLQQSFIALLQSGHTGKNLLELCQRLDIQKPNGNFLLLEFFNHKTLCRSDRIPQSPFSDPEMNLLLEQITYELGKSYGVVTAPYGDNLLCLVKCYDVLNMQQMKPYLLEQIAALNTMLSGNFLYAAVSPLIDGVRNLPDGFTAVKQLADYKSIMESRAPDILFSDEFPSETWISPGVMVSDEQRHFVFLVRIGAFAEAIPTAVAICKQKLLSPAFVYNLSLVLAALKDTFIHTLGSACTELNMFDDYVQLKVVHRIAGAQAALELETEMEAVLTDLDIAFSKLNHADNLPQRIKSYIDENYRNPDLNVNAVADFFEISTAHATKVFKNQYGCTILDYIHDRRIFTAKEMLGSGQSISDIAKYSGYGSSSNMIRAFRRIEGTTPGQLQSGHMNNPE